ncbi:hypothetical protein Glove_166g248 [Diversispora epigaea]|uniref:DNA primase n=1 Tax=Diversispora epigaea TaxID=1348612 RepID=A0A397IV12_9GLOM|nr:hypothetical protein Glove_166g248 [Diversispora epigaea]
MSLQSENDAQTSLMEEIEEMEEIVETEELEDIEDTEKNTKEELEADFWRNPSRTILQAGHESQDFIPDTSELLRFFYTKLFPYKIYAEWLNYSKEIDKKFINREFSFQLSNEAVIRHLSFNNPDELKAEIVKQCPLKIDIGAVYSAKPKDKRSLRPSAYKPVEKELVFDIDLTDYDDIRTCYKGGDICLKCWQFMTVAIKILDVALREDFGFKHLLWIYSGRRGVHCWICDERARKLNNDERKAIVSYLEVIKGGAQQHKKVYLYKNMHSSLKRSLVIIEDYFEQIVLEDQDVLKDEQNWTKVLNCIPDEGLRKELNKKWLQLPLKPSIDKWHDLKSEISHYKNKKNQWRLDSSISEIMFQYLYPRLDDKVTTQINHLLKSPFCVHPKTERVCVPISPDNCENFDPLKVPTLTTLYRQLNETNNTASDKSGTKRIHHEYEKCSLKSYMKYFENFVEGIMKEIREKNREASEMSMEF